MNQLADLHMHSFYSDDGEFSPAELVQKCLLHNIGIMAIADHNCVRANEEGAKAAREAGIAYIRATEIDCTFEGINLHVLGYGIDCGGHDFAMIESNISRDASAASRERLAATRRLGFEVAESDLEALADKMYWKDRWTGEMFAEVLLNKPEYRGHELLRPYRRGGPRGDNPYVNFYWDFYSQGKPCYVETRFPSFEQVLQIIHGNGGTAVLAHPGVQLTLDEPGILDRLVAGGLDGIEAFSSYHSPSQALRLYSRAKAYNILATCGSDFHGKTKPAIQPGQHGGSLSEREMEQLLSALAGG